MSKENLKERLAYFEQKLEEAKRRNAAKEPHPRNFDAGYTTETFKHWDFAAPSEKDLSAVTQFFNVGITPGDAKSLTHSLSTIIIGKDGKVAAWYPTNDWQPADLVAEIRKVAAAGS